MTVGRPCLLNEDTYSTILEAIAHGCPEGLSAEAAGVTDRTLCDWKKIGNEDLEKGNNTKFSQLVLDIKKAKLKLMQKCLKRIIKTGKKPEYWTADAWILERIYRKHFGKDADLYEEVKKEQDEIKALLKQLLEKKEIPNG